MSLARRFGAVGKVGVTVVVGLAGCTPPHDAGVGPERTWFEDVAGDHGLSFHHVSGATGAFLLPEIMGSGAAFADVDGDGDLDAYFVQSGTFGSVSNTFANQLFLNRGDGHFVLSPGSGAEDGGYGMGVATGDYDGDGDIDLYVTNVGANVLLRNDGDGSFTDVTGPSGTGDPGFGTAATFFDPDGDGDLDLFVVNYVAWSPGMERDCYNLGTGVRNYCDPGNYQAPALDRLYRNNGDGTFADVSAAAGLLAARGNGLGVISADFDNNGHPDIFVANDKTMNRLWLNQGGLVFVDEAILWGCAMDDHGITKAGMGVAVGDVDDDGDADLLVVNIEGETDSLFRNENSYFVDASAALGLGTVSRRYTRFGVVMADFDSDGWLDLFEANGRVTYATEAEAKDVFAEPNRLYRGKPGGRFTVEPLTTPARSRIHTSRGVALGDVDGDGGLDLLVMNKDAAPYLLLNRHPGRQRSVRFRLVDEKGIDVHGATVTGTVGDARKTRYVQAAGSYLSASERVAHFGLGDAPLVLAVVVRWPDGTSEAFGDYPPNGVIVLTRGAGNAPAT